MSIELLDRVSLVDGAAQSSGAAARPWENLLGRIGSLETRIARNEREIDAAQAVRYRVFIEEMGAQIAPDSARRKRDIDAWDPVCDHLLVLDRSVEGDPEDQIVGTYRLLRHDVARNHGGFYSATEFDVEALMARH